ncbi:uncharacterized protein Z520_10515 [Fonsecaea multimorphosa CBS 102226]|uniref:Ubiquitin-like domain-containing protein n=1 Tax=Fonsecaea multimorphosa CBS 102226 TaxID=1442371 RepID=A0A0D2GWB8_9EURO|nr:uncharacterized protein Z520_10515 [Fonsecaea multimorphosa CBS 102226]KIX93890.1 hypothetical protein Z520_10515 [Fonsecaea multimorphosa CBS 102226]OAL19127.1 hypothetical protein AYO22_10075 [Fonsecaea multimorphosa]
MTTPAVQTNMHTSITINKPTVLSPDLRKCRNVGDLVATVGREIFNEMEPETFLYTVQGDDGVQVPLNGPDYDPERSLPFADSALHISARPKQPDFYVYVHLPQHEFTQPWPAHGRVNVQWCDTGRRVKERINAEYGIPNTYFYELSLGNRHIVDSKTLYEQKIYGDCVVAVRLIVAIKFRFNNETCTAWVWNDDKMTKLLKKIARKMDNRIEDVRFAIIKCSGTVTEAAEQWLPNRSRFFLADGAEGTVEDNGLRFGDEIRAFCLLESSRRARESIDRESMETE